MKINITHKKGQEFIVRIGNVADTYYLNNCFEFEPHFGRLNKYEEEIHEYFWSVVNVIFRNEELTKQFSDYSDEEFYKNIGLRFKNKVA